MRQYVKRMQPRWFFISLLLAVLVVSLVKIPNFELLSSPEDDAPSLLVQTLMSLGRMFLAYIVALVFGVFFGVLAGTNRNRALVILPVTDILQSVPLLSFFPTAIFYFMQLGPPKFGVEAAVIFLIFTCQAWNLLFAVYDSIRLLPESTFDSVRACGLGPMARLTKLYLPAAFPRLIDNSNLSWSNGWYFLMACEIIALGSMSYRVHGLGSYLASALERREWTSFYMAIGLLIVVIVLMDFLIWKPLAALAKHYRFDADTSEEAEDKRSEWLLTLYKNHLLFWPLRACIWLVQKIFSLLENFSEDKYSPEKSFQPKKAERFTLFFAIFFWTCFSLFALWSMVQLYHALFSPHELSPLTIFQSILTSGARIVVAYFLSLLWILPLTYWLHRSPVRMRRVQTVAQVLAGIPATAFFPLIALIGFQLFRTKEIAVILMLLTGMQWYLLFNILGGAQNIGSELKDISSSLGLSHKLYLQKIFFPVIAPAFLTGSITAIGGGWNALFIAEHIQIAGDTFRVFGIGDLLAQATFVDGNKSLVAYSVFFMVLFIVLLNRLFWQPLYNWAEQKFRLDM
jgi:NitT/TauT family transport system permease protein